MSIYYSTRKNATIGGGSIIAAAVTVFFETLRKRYDSVFRVLLMPIFLVLPLDVTTRWNSTYLMLNLALKFRVVFDKMEEEEKLYNDHFWRWRKKKKGKDLHGIVTRNQ